MRTVLITGSNRGIGLELVKSYLAHGDRVLATCRAPAEAVVLNELAGDHETLSIYPLAVADADSVAELGADLGATPIDVLINNAGVNTAFEAQTLEQMDYDAFASMFEVNAMAPLRVLQQFLPNLQASEAKPAKVITISSILGSIEGGFPVGFAYSPSKAAVNKLMFMAAGPLSEQGIAVGLIHPGWVQTDMGGPDATVSVPDSAAGIVRVIDELDLASTGCFRDYEGKTLPW